MQAIAPNEILQKLLLQSQKLVFIWDVSNNELVFLNDAFEYIWKRPSYIILAMPSIILDSLHPQDKDYLMKEYQELVSGVPKQDIEFRVIMPDQTEGWLMLTPFFLEGGDGKQYVGGIVDDITSVKDNIRNLERFAAKKDSVLEILSHDLAGPLAIIKSLADSLSQNTADYNNKEVQKIFEIISESSARSIRLIRDFVQQEFLESSKVTLVKRRVNVVEKVREVIEQYKQGEDHIYKKFKLKSSHDKLFMKLDISKFMQVINNLISNAIKFTHDDGLISTEILDQGESVLITICDNGIGIPQQLQDDLFDKFTKARRPGLRGEPSTGLGMSLIKTIVGWHNGRIWFKSEENKGTTFYIELPKG